jgi:hypothetical protein
LQLGRDLQRIERAALAGALLGHVLADMVPEPAVRPLATATGATVLAASS